MAVKRITIDIPGVCSYDCRVGEGCTQSLGEKLRSLSALVDCNRILLLTDSNVGPMHAASLNASLSSSGFHVDEISIPAGEKSKQLVVAEEIWSAMAQLGLGRYSAICALGGGVVGDLGGFVAACYMRGIPVVQVPTSLLAMVDSSIGGKTAVNLAEGKNLVGAFHQPVAVFSDTSFLDTLPAAQLRCGLAEVVKSALLSDDDFFFWLDGMFSGAPIDKEATLAHALQEIVVRSVVLKSSIVVHDPFEKGEQRAYLNLGHTFGHALEQCAGFGKYSHGQCVAEGIRFAARVAEAELGAPSEFSAAQDDLLDRIGLPRLKYDIDSACMLEAMGADKKNRNEGIRFVLMRDLGKPELHTIESGLVNEYLNAWKEMSL